MNKISFWYSFDDGEPIKIKTVDMIPPVDLPTPPVELPAAQLASRGSFNYSGYFRLPKGKIGSSRAENGSAIAVVGDTFYFIGQWKRTSIAQFKIPAYGETAEVIQPFVNVMPAINPDRIDRLTGMMSYNERLIVNGQRYYDGSGKAMDTTFVIHAPEDLDVGYISLFRELQGAAHASFWLSNIPIELQDALGGDVLAGSADNLPIAMRHSIGPSAFSLDGNDLVNYIGVNKGQVKTTALMDFDLKNQMSDDRYNNGNTELRNNKNQDALSITVGSNVLWTAVSWAAYGFIIPGTRTYAVFGSSGGHESSVGYKIDDESGYRCAGRCAYTPTDYQNYYWLFNVDDLIAVRNGDKLPHEPRPYEYGVFPVPEQFVFDSGTNPPHNLIRGGDYDAATGKLYLTLSVSDDGYPVVLVYDVAV